MLQSLLREMSQKESEVDARIRGNLVNSFCNLAILSFLRASVATGDLEANELEELFTAWRTEAERVTEEVLSRPFRLSWWVRAGVRLGLVRVEPDRQVRADMDGMIAAQERYIRDFIFKDNPGLEAWNASS